jgi:hypothetical protein
VYIAAGLLAWWRRPSSRLGLLIVLAGGACLLSALANIDTPVTRAVGAVLQTLGPAVITQLLLAFPTGGLQDAAQRLVVAAGYAVCLVLEAPLYLFTKGGPLTIADRPDLADAGLQVQRAAGALVVLAMAALLVARMRRSNPAQRRVLVPLLAYGIFALLFIPVSSALSDSLFGGHVIWRDTAQVVVVALVPIVFVAAASRGGFARTSDIAELGVWLGADEVERPDLRDALAATLGDPTVALLVPPAWR